METSRIDVAEIGRTGLFEAHFNGVVIVRGTRQPFLDAARILKGRGIAGRLEMWGGEPPKLRMTGDVDVLAGLTVREDRKRGPIVTSYKAFPYADVRPPAAGKGSG